MATKRTRKKAAGSVPRGYRDALEGTPRPTRLRVPITGSAPGMADLEARLRALPIASVAPILHEDASVAVRATFGGEPEGLPVTIAVRESRGGIPSTELDWSRLTKPEVDAAIASRFDVEIEATLRRGSVLADYHLLLRTAGAVAPDAAAVLDTNAFRTHPPRWLADAAASRVPPSPTALFTIHSVYDDDGGGKDATVWMHTHGLLRCGTLELEMAEIPLDALSTMGTLLNTAASMFIEGRVPGPRRPFQVGRGIDLVWLPWQDVMPMLEPGTLGAEEDRDDDHSAPSGFLFAPGDKGRVVNAASHHETLEDNPVLYVSDMETARMSELSRERLPTLIALQKEHGADPEWQFLVKLGFEVDGAETATDREHLWFDVHAIRGRGPSAEIDATLLNEPYHVARLHEGDRAWQPLKRVSGWSILSPRGRFGPESALDLERRFEKPSDEDLQ